MLSTKHRKRSRGSRGIIAMITGLSVLFVVTFSILMAELGLASLQRYEMHDASEAMAMAEGFQVLSQPSPNFGNRVPATPLATDNARDGSVGSLAMTNYSIPVYPGPTLTANDAGGKGYQANGSPQLSYISTMGAPLSVGGNARVVVNQFQVIDMTPIPARIMLVVDYSRSMRLTYPGGGLAAKTILQNAINNILSDPKLTGRVDWGILLFADSVGSNEGPLGPPNVYNAGAIAGQVASIRTDIAGQTFGNGTDLATAVNTASGLLTGGGYSYGDINYGKNVMIIVTDGEPDVDTTMGPNAPYDQLVASATAKAQTAVQSAWAQGIQTITILIKRDTTLAATADETFMASIAGDGKPGGPTGQVTANAGVADYAGGLGDFLRMINPANHCISSSSISPPASSWMPAPDATGSIYGFWVKPNAGAYNENTVTRYVNNENMDPPPNPTSGEYNPDRAGFYYDPRTGKVELNSSICLQYLQNQANPPRFRARYGLPRISWIGSL